MTGPSARGSLNGTPTSSISAPSAVARRSASRERAGVGNPAVRNGMSAARRSARTAAQRPASGRSDKVVADLDTVLDRIGDLDDGARERALLVPMRGVGEESGMLNGGPGRRDDPDHGPV